MYNARELVGRVGIVFSEAVVGDTSNKLRFLAGWRSLVSRLPHKQKVCGSNPHPATKLSRVSNVEHRC